MAASTEALLANTYDVASIPPLENYLNQQELERQKRSLSENRHNRIKVTNQMIKPIVDMKSAYNEVRKKGNITLDKDMVSATSNRRV